MCGTRPLRFSTRASVTETSTEIVKLKTIVSDTPKYTFNLHLNVANPTVTSGYRIPNSNNKYTVLLCQIRWDEIRSKPLNAEVEVEWDDHFNLTTMKFTG